MSERKTASGDSTRRPEPAKPRLSASVLLLNAKNEILMIQRTKESRTFSGMHAFPGGNHDPSQDGNDTRVTAIRELFEETGILLASPDTPAPKTSGNVHLSPERLALSRQAIHSRTDPLTFPAFLNESGLGVQKAANALIPFSQWTTPTTAKSRYWTWFYVAALEEFPDVLVAGDAPQNALNAVLPSKHQSTTGFALAPSHDGHIEISTAYFQSPRLVIESFDRGEISIMPPQYYLMKQLDRITNLRTDGPSSVGAVQSSETTAERIRRVAVQSNFGSRGFNPRPGGRVTAKDGTVKTVLMYEGDKDYEYGRIREEDGRDTSSGGKHRNHLTFKEGVPASIELFCDIDVLGLHDPGTGSAIGNARL